MPQLDSAVLRASGNERQLRVEADGGDVVAVAVQGLNAGLGLVVPNLNQAVVGARHQVGAVAACKATEVGRDRRQALAAVSRDARHLVEAVAACRGGVREGTQRW